MTARLQAEKLSMRNDKSGHRTRPSLKETFFTCFNRNLLKIILRQQFKDERMKKISRLHFLNIFRFNEELSGRFPFISPIFRPNEHSEELPTTTRLFGTNFILKISLERWTGSLSKTGYRMKLLQRMKSLHTSWDELMEEMRILTPFPLSPN